MSHKHNIRNNYQVHKSDTDGLPSKDLLLQAEIMVAHQRYDEAYKRNAPLSELRKYLETAQQALEELTALIMPESTVGELTSNAYMDAMQEQVSHFEVGSKEWFETIEAIDPDEMGGDVDL